jgi:hypothetical protein
MANDEIQERLFEGSTSDIVHQSPLVLKPSMKMDQVNVATKDGNGGWSRYVSRDLQLPAVESFKAAAMGSSCLELKSIL